MKGLLDGDKKLQEAALKGLIEASGRLGLDPTRYRNALAVLHPGKKPRKTAASPSAKKGVAVKVMPEAGVTRRTLKRAKVDDGRLTLAFSGAIPKKGIRHFVLRRKESFLYVYDIVPAMVPFTIKRIKGEGFKEIRIAQYDPRKVRVVIETRQRYEPKLTRSGEGTILIDLPGAKARKGAGVTPSPAPAKKVEEKKRKKRVKKRPVAVPPPETPRSEAAVMAPPMLRRYTVVIDPGHGGKDAGAVGYRRKREKDVVLAVAKELEKELKKRGFNVYLTRSGDRFIPLKRRTRYANRKQADFFISIHANAAAKRSHWNKSRGIETYFLSRARTGRAKRVAAIENSSDVKNVDRYTKDAYLSLLNREKIVESNKLAIDLQRQMLTSVRRRYKDVVDNGVREGPFWVLVGAQMPAVLIEIGYITNPTEAKRLSSKRYQKLLAEGIANGIQSYIYHNEH